MLMMNLSSAVSIWKLKCALKTTGLLLSYEVSDKRVSLNMKGGCQVMQTLGVVTAMVYYASLLVCFTSNRAPNATALRCHSHYFPFILLFEVTFHSSFPLSVILVCCVFVT